MKTILVVEDEPSVAQVICLLLEDEGYKIVTAANGKEGLDQLSRLRPDLVLSDIMMPIVSGIDLFRAMQADPVLRQIPLVFMSAAAEPLTGGGRNLVGFLRKPFSRDALIHLVTVGLE